MVMSGRTVWHIPGRAGNPHTTNVVLVPADLAENTMAAVFNRAGYKTMRTCKHGNSYEAANALFTVRHDATKRGGTDETGSAWHAEQVLDYLNEREARRDTDPFLIYFGFSHPHDTRDGKPELLAKIRRGQPHGQEHAATGQSEAARPAGQLPVRPILSTTVT